MNEEKTSDLEESEGVSAKTQNDVEMNDVENKDSDSNSQEVILHHEQEEEESSSSTAAENIVEKKIISTSSVIDEDRENEKDVEADVGHSIVSISQPEENSLDHLEKNCVRHVSNEFSSDEDEEMIIDEFYDFSKSSLPELSKSATTDKPKTELEVELEDNQEPSQEPKVELKSRKNVHRNFRNRNILVSRQSTTMYSFPQRHPKRRKLKFTKIISDNVEANNDDVSHEPETKKVKTAVRSDSSDEAVELIPESTNDPLQIPNYSPKTTYDDRFEKFGTTLRKVKTSTLADKITKLVPQATIVSPPNSIRDASSNLVDFFSRRHDKTVQIVKVNPSASKVTSTPLVVRRAKSKETKNISDDSHQKKEETITNRPPSQGIFLAIKASEFIKKSEPSFIIHDETKTLSIKPTASSTISTKIAQPGPSNHSTRVLNTPAVTKMFNKVSLQKKNDGSYCIIQNKSQKPTAETIVQPEKEKKEQIPERRDSVVIRNVTKKSSLYTLITKELRGNVGMSSVDAVNEKPDAIVKTIDSGSRSIQSSSTSTKDDFFEQQSKILASRDRRNSMFESHVKQPPETVKYTIPQGMLHSTSEAIKNHVKSFTETPTDTSMIDCSEMFVAESEMEKEVIASTTILKNRRKSVLAPKNADDEMSFEEPPFKMPLRPQANIDLIENLATYRAYMINILKKLDIPQFDLNEDGDEYINLYKIFRS